MKDNIGNKILNGDCFCLIIECTKFNNQISNFDLTIALLAKCDHFTASSSDKKWKQKNKNMNKALDY